MLSDIAYRQARQLILESVPAPTVREVAVQAAADATIAATLHARVSCPGLDASLRDGFAVRAADAAHAVPHQPVVLRLAGAAVAGAEPPVPLGSNQAVAVTTGAPLPSGADCVVQTEDCTRQGTEVHIPQPPLPGQHVLCAGADVRAGDVVAAPGQVLTPARTGLLAAAGLHRVPVYAAPRLGLLATGDEVVAPGQPLAAGQLYASNLVTLAGWAARFGMPASSRVVCDDFDAMRTAAAALLEDCDALVTSGGAWKSARDVTRPVLQGMGWQPVFQGVRLGPGKGVSFGLLAGKPVFCLPGGPTANEITFALLALPGLLTMAGRGTEPLTRCRVRLAADLDSQPDWTRVVQARLEESGGEPRAVPLLAGSRLQAQAEADAWIVLPEGTTRVAAGEFCDVRLLHPNRRFA